MTHGVRLPFRHREDMLKLPRSRGVVRDLPSFVPFERWLLGICILESSRIGEAVGEGLLPEDFFRPEHEALWALLLNMREIGDPIDIGTVTERVHRHRPDRYGGVPYVAELPDHAPPGVNIAYYARRIRAKAAARIAIGVLWDLEEQIRRQDELPFLAEQVVALLAGRDPDLEHQLVAYLTAGAEPILDREALRRVWMAVGERWGWTRAPERMAAK
jgi:hypothetical protein